MSMLANLVRANARALTAVSRSSVHSLSFRAPITRPTPLHQTRMTLPRSTARRWMSGESRTTEPRKVLFLSNLPFNMMEDDIRYELQDFGVITDVYKGTDKMTGRSNGWARVEFETEDEAESVLREQHARPFLFGGRTAVIKFSKNQSATHVHTRSEPDPSPTLYVGNLSFNASEQEVFSSFSQYGSIKRVAIARSLEGTPRGFAHVEFFDLRAAIEAYGDASSSPMVIQGRPVFLDYQLPKPYKP